MIRSVFLFCFFLGIFFTSSGIVGNLPKQGSPSFLKVSTFDIDATPHVGNQLAYNPMINTWDLSLRARGVVIQGAGKPIVLCAIDWIGISNESQDVFKEAIASAVHTDPKRVAVHTLHQHDAPICDFSAEKILKNAGIDPGAFEGSYARGLLKDLKEAVKNSLKNAQPVSHISFGEALVYQVASNRRIVNKEGKVGQMRGSSCKDSLLITQPEGLIDPMVSVIGFWNDENPVAILSFYATHPQSYYLTGVPNPDFPGVARFLRQLAVPDALHVHFTGAGGNIAAGKYNDGSKENRGILGERLADGMERAWKSSKKVNVTKNHVEWETYAISLPPADNLEEIEVRMKNPKNRFYLTNYMGKLAWFKRQQAGKSIDLACLSLGDIRILFMPGELFVEYQLAAKAMRPDLHVAMAAYGDFGPLYIGTKEAYDQGGYEIGASPVTGEAEKIIMIGIRELLDVN